MWKYLKSLTFSRLESHFDPFFTFISIHFPLNLIQFTLEKNVENETFFSIFQTLWLGLHLDWLTSIQDLNYCCIDNSTISFCFWESQIGKSLKKIIDYSSFCRRPRTFAWCGFVFLRSVFGVLRVIRAFDQFQIAVIATFQSLQLIYRSHPLKTILNGKVMALHTGLNSKILFKNPESHRKYYSVISFAKDKFLLKISFRKNKFYWKLDIQKKKLLKIIF